MSNKIKYYTQDDCSFCRSFEPHLRTFMNHVGDEVELETINVTGDWKTISNAGGTTTPYVLLETAGREYELTERSVVAMLREYQSLLQTDQ